MDEAVALFWRVRYVADQIHTAGGRSETARGVLRGLVRYGARTVPQLAFARSVTRQHIQEVVDGLIADGLVQRAVNPAHARSPLIQPTRKGLTVVAALDAAGRAHDGRDQQEDAGLTRRARHHDPRPACDARGFRIDHLDELIDRLSQRRGLARHRGMQPRMQQPAVMVPAAMQALMALHAASTSGGVARTTSTLIHLRASQINGCSYCVDMHARELHHAGESDQRIWAVAAWRDATFFTDAERAALALTEAVTRLADREDAVSDALWAEVAAHYDEAGIASLLLSIAGVNVWNRLNVATRQRIPVR